MTGMLISEDVDSQDVVLKDVVSKDCGSTTFWVHRIVVPQDCGSMGFWFHSIGCRPSRSWNGFRSCLLCESATKILFTRHVFNIFTSFQMRYCIKFYLKRH